MKVTSVEEHEDGSADVVLEDISKAEMSMLVQEGLISILKRALDKEQESRKIAALLKPTKEENIVQAQAEEWQFPGTSADDFPNV